MPHWLCGPPAGRHGHHRDGRPGVTTDLNVSYFSAAPSGAVVRVAGRTVKCGRTLAFVEVDLFLEVEGERGKHLAQGRMTKFLGSA